MDTKLSERRPISRQPLACIQCRGRKVKCDKTKPCSACCYSGNPTQCEFVVVDGSDRVPIQQACELRELQRENKRLREQLNDSLSAQAGEQKQDLVSNTPSFDEGRTMSNSPKKRYRLTTQQTSEWSSKGAVSFVETMNVLPTVDHVLWQAPDTAYPFPTISIGDGTTVALTRLLPPRHEIIAGIKMFRHLGQTFPISQPPDQIKEEVMSTFLNNIEANATREPDTLAILLAALALVVQSNMTSHQNQHSAHEAEVLFAQSECYMTASMQALRNASFVHRPTLVGIKALLIIQLYLMKSGRLHDAWTLFGTTIRLAHLIQLHRNPDNLTPAPTASERSIRESLWQLMLYSDQYLSIALARPLGISSCGDCPPPIHHSTNPDERRLHWVVGEFTTITRQILSSEGTSSNAAKFTQRLLRLWEKMPEALLFREAWVQREGSLPGWPLDVISASIFARLQFFIVLLNSRSTTQSPPSSDHSTSTGNMSPDDDKRSPPISNPNTESSLVIKGCVQLLRAFHFLWQRRSITLPYQMLEQEALSAVMTLLRIVQQTRNRPCLQMIHKTRLVFVEMQLGGVNKFAELAVSRIDDGFVQLRGTRNNSIATDRSVGSAGSSGMMDLG